MNLNLILNIFLIIIILHLLLTNINNKKLEFMENDNNEENKKEHTEQNNSGEQDNTGEQNNNERKSSIVNDIKEMEKRIVGSVGHVLNKDNLKYIGYNEDSNNIIPAEQKINRLKEFNNKPVSPALNINNSKFGQDDNKDLNYSECCDLEIKDINLDDNGSLDKYYPSKMMVPPLQNPAAINSDKRNDYVPTQLINQSASCSYNTTDDIHLLHPNEFTEYVNEEKNNKLDSVNTPCASNITDNMNFCETTGMDINEKPNNGGKIGNYMGYNSCNSEYAMYKSIS